MLYWLCCCSIVRSSWIFNQDNKWLISCFFKLEERVNYRSWCHMIVPGSFSNRSCDHGASDVCREYCSAGWDRSQVYISFFSTFALYAYNRRHHHCHGCNIIPAARRSFDPSCLEVGRIPSDYPVPATLGNWVYWQIKRWSGHQQCLYHIQTSLDCISLSSRGYHTTALSVTPH